MRKYKKARGARHRAESKGHGAEGVEGGGGTRRRPIGRDYAAAKDAENTKRRRRHTTTF
jgi:hypothetical protein